MPQRAAYWAGALDPSERGDPLAVEGTTDRLLESIHKAACLQMMDDPKPVPFQQSPMMISVDAERMTPLIRGLPNSLQLFGIQLQGKLEALSPFKRVIAALRGTTSSSARDTLARESKTWTWGDVAQELINFQQNYGPVKTAVSQPETRRVRHS